MIGKNGKLSKERTLLKIVRKKIYGMKKNREAKERLEKREI